MLGLRNFGSISGLLAGGLAGDWKISGLNSGLQKGVAGVGRWITRLEGKQNSGE
jgi:hypothetical protein